MRWCCILVLAWAGSGLGGCAAVTRIRRALAPESFVTPEVPVGQLAAVTVDAGWRDEPPGPYVQPTAFKVGDTTWVRPVSLTDRARLTVVPIRPDITVGLYSRHIGLVPRDFSRVLARSGSLKGELPTAIRFEPTGALGNQTYTLEIRDLQNVYSDDALQDGDLLMVELRAVGQVSERYVFQTHHYGWRTRGGAGVLVRVPLPGQESAALTPALAASLTVGYRARTRRPVISFLGEQVAAVGSVGVGSTVLQEEGVENQLNGAFNAALVGGGVELLQIFSVQMLGNASAPFRNDQESNWALAVGFDAVQFARFADHLGTRILHENPMVEERFGTPGGPHQKGNSEDE